MDVPRRVQRKKCRNAGAMQSNRCATTFSENGLVERRLIGCAKEDETSHRKGQQRMRLDRRRSGTSLSSLICDPQVSFSARAAVARLISDLSGVREP